MQNILLGPSQRSFTCENTVCIQPLAACTKPQGESTLKWCKVHRLDTNPQNQTPRAAFRLAELVSPLTPTCLSHYGRREPRSRANTMAAQCSPLVMEGPCTWGRMPRHKSLIKGPSGKGKSWRFMKKAEIKWLMLWIWVWVASGEHAHPHILQLNFLLHSRVIFKRTKHLIFLAIICNESPGLISITSAYH